MMILSPSIASPKTRKVIALVEIDEQASVIRASVEKDGLLALKRTVVVKRDRHVHRVHVLLAVNRSNLGVPVRKTIKNPQPAQAAPSPADSETSRCILSARGRPKRISSRGAAQKLPRRIGATQPSSLIFAGWEQNMPDYKQADRPLSITTPLGKDVLLVTRLRGKESISQLFNFQLDLLAEVATDIRFDKILAQTVTVEMHLLDGTKRYFNGLVRRFSQGAREERFIRYRAEIVPKIWLLSKKVQSRIFQHLTVPEIIQQVLKGFEVNYEIHGTYYQRDYCVQYRESDLDFISRLMEEEGIYYFFSHTNDTHQMKVTDIPNQHPAVAGQTNVIYDELSGGEREDMRISAWEKTQELRSGEYTLWDHSFELPGKNLQVKEKTIESVAAGKVTHKLNVGGNDKLEIYDYPGGYAQRFDGIDPSGGARPQDLKDVFRDSERTTRIRMEQEEVRTLAIEAKSNCGNFSAGFKFNLERHFNGDGPYLLTRVEHDASMEGNYQTGEFDKFDYQNNFGCIPFALSYRPQRVTPRPVISGNQTATVVGPKGEELFCDKYGRVKVQFHWDREGKQDASSSCWIRVAQVWAGKGWGAFFWPRIGHEVVVLFEEGDPDQPLIVGSVYNADNMPPYGLPKANMFCGFKSASLRGQAGKNFNGIVFVDKKGQEHLALHSERHMDFNAEFDKVFRTGRHSGETVPGARSVTIGSLPGGGGSGGGGPDDNLWPKGSGGVQPLAVLGINSTVVYGGNFQVAMPLNFQMAVGSNLQICINPASFFNIFPDAAPTVEAMAGALGAGFGGNMQLTLGTSANFVMGQSYDINLGPKRIVIDTHAKTLIQPVCRKLGIAMEIVVFVFLIAYAALHDDDLRAALLLVFQATMQILLVALMQTQSLYHKADEKGDDIYRGMYVVQKPDPKDPDKNIECPEGPCKGESGFESGLVENAAILTLYLLPPLLESIGEGKLDEVKPDPNC
jgi:type VI secretion system secreted protein VgrG